MTLDEPIRLLGGDDLRARGIERLQAHHYRKSKQGTFRPQSIRGSLPLGLSMKSTLTS